MVTARTNHHQEVLRVSASLFKFNILDVHVRVREFRVSGLRFHGVLFFARWLSLCLDGATFAVFTDSLQGDYRTGAQLTTYAPLGQQMFGRVQAVGPSFEYRILNQVNRTYAALLPRFRY